MLKPLNTGGAKGSPLEEILKEKKKEIGRLNTQGWAVNGSTNLPPVRNFKKAISLSNRIGLIAEIKFASPSAGFIREVGDPQVIGRIYERAGAAAISLLTEKKFFNGDIHNLPALKESTSLPILRKDFIIDRVQLLESRLCGADAVLLISRILPKQKLKEFIETCRELGLDALVEVHDEDDLQKALACGADIVGINNRDLTTFDVNLGATFDLAPMVPEGITTVSESGFYHGSDIKKFKELKIQAVLVGSALMRSDDLAKKTEEFVRALS